MSTTLYSSGTVVTSANLNSIDTAVYNNLTAVAGTNTITATGPLSMTAYITGQRFSFVPVNAITGAVTININGLGAKAITKFGTTALVTGDMVTAALYYIIYDGTQFQLINPPPGNQTIPAANLSGQVAIANGGTGASTAAAARTALNVAQIGPAFCVTRTADQNIANAVATKVQFNVETFDTDGAFDSTTNYRFQPTVAGYYNVSWSIAIDFAGTTAGPVYSALCKNGPEFCRGSQLNLAAGAGVTYVLSTGATVVFLNGSSDYLEVIAFQANPATATLAIDGTSPGCVMFSGHFVRPT